MQLAEFATADCQGLVLAHRQNFADGSLPKGTILTAGHLAELGAAGAFIVAKTFGFQYCRHWPGQYQGAGTGHYSL